MSDDLHRGVFFNHLGQTIEEPGLTHLALSVEDAPGLLARVPEYGGEVLEQSRGAESAWGQAIYIRDPDGQLIEIVTMAWRTKLPPPPVDGAA